ncbi:NUDIX hydrolase [Rhizobium lusitanum]|uniref:8-oxo-dGTP pyrophosphatase MutT (NUDIX family) n=1 Tax=Rhizobium lusitanum TaxID=293958 RepID=A0A7X0IQP9_9HYPH|nr:NUDIX hydrolase [Rhizobium lusitanum]MBB6483931.1 8-oxo-dGTP pyrophosphatase MutT (NUDIX family) [Rhizobium lusitanum]
MSKRKLIRLNAGRSRFQMRVAGLAFRDGHVLVHRAVQESFWTFPGGRAEIGETSEDTLRREMQEELGVDATVMRLLWSVENFFHYEERDWHELGLYYLMEIPASFPFDPQEIVHRVQDGDNDLEFKWVRATREALVALDIPPYFIAEEIEDLPLTPRHLVWRDGDLDQG